MAGGNAGFIQNHIEEKGSRMYVIDCNCLPECKHEDYEAEVVSTFSEHIYR